MRRKPSGTSDTSQSHLAWHAQLVCLAALRFMGTSPTSVVPNAKSG